jgi:twitching motility protein PilT
MVMTPLYRRAAMTLIELLCLARKRQASDLHLSAGLPPLLRVQGELTALPGEPLGAEQVQALVETVLSPAQRQAWAQMLDLDAACELPGLGRFRLNAFHQHRGPAAALRLIASRIATLAELDAPPLLAEWALKPHGLALVTGPTGSGKSSTLAAMLAHLNAQTRRHVISIEDPIEFIHPPGQCLMHQREVPAHTRSFAQALRAALREDPDVIALGELRDLETISLALTAAETGHLVLATLHTASAAKTVDRLVDVFPAGEKELIRSMLAESLLGVVSQVLARGPQGRVAVHELLSATPAVRHLIRENKVAQLYSVIQTGAAQGMQTLDQALALRVRQGRVIPEEARRLARSPENMPS